MLREVIDACNDLDLEETVCAKACVTILRGMRLRMLLKDAMLARDSGGTVLRMWVRSLYHASTSSSPSATA